jgi:hypothetical protein
MGKLADFSLDQLSVTNRDEEATADSDEEVYSKHTLFIYI